MLKQRRNRNHSTNNIIIFQDLRFVNLLKPIKDLTANWSVPLSNYLQDYLEEIKEVELELDGQTAKLNFAEAALLLQGSVSVYSKKVEFLWQNVLRMLDLLASKKALEEAENGEEDAGNTCFLQNSYNFKIMIVFWLL